MKRVDDNQKEVVAGLRRIGCTVHHLSSLGKGCPDLLIGFKGVNYLVELKDGSKPPSRRKLTPDELKWIKNWKGQVNVCCSIEEIIKLLNN